MRTFLQTETGFGSTSNRIDMLGLSDTLPREKRLIRVYINRPFMG
jgi:hypothetical protein